MAFARFLRGTRAPRLNAGTLSCLAHHGTPLSERCPTTTALERTIAGLLVEDVCTSFVRERSALVQKAASCLCRRQRLRVFVDKPNSRLTAQEPRAFFPENPCAFRLRNINRIFFRRCTRNRQCAPPRVPGPPKLACPRPARRSKGHSTRVRKLWPAPTCVHAGRQSRGRERGRGGGRAYTGSELLCPHGLKY
jgi:hypothetical protein